ncbi:hypothetical protein CEXT_405171 [Caerostris extrusa]|uniref:Uncharacterized protein n=1 Tax=Caerostris extrusa TaxID=172846 RepID=A0AAV4NKB6_CAEEX|nr:hypothetical protein CEXT_405171 [Caerostris extrusa]
MAVRIDEHKIAKTKIWMQSLHKNNGQTEDTKGLLMQVLLFSLCWEYFNKRPATRGMEFKDLLFSDPKQFEKGQRKGVPFPFFITVLLRATRCLSIHGKQCVKFYSDFFLFPSKRCLGQHHQGHKVA